MRIFDTLIWVLMITLLAWYIHKWCAELRFYRSIISDLIDKLDIAYSEIRELKKKDDHDLG
jgi:hypothetical protein